MANSWLEINIDYKKIVERPEESAFTPNAIMTKIFSTGQKRVISNFLWIHTLLTADLNQYKKSDKSWLFYRFFLISVIDPYFYENYASGAQYLSVIKDDIQGATYLFDEGARRFPGHYEVNLFGGIHSLIELKDSSKAIVFLERAAKANYFVSRVRYRFLHSLLSKLYKDHDRNEMAIKILEAGIQESSSELIKNQYNEKLKRLRQDK